MGWNAATRGSASMALDPGASGVDYAR